MNNNIKRRLSSAAASAAIFVTCGITSPAALAESVSFLVDPATIDANNDGFITGNEFTPVGSDGTVFSLVPTNNLVGGDRFLLSDTTGLHFGGGGGSTLAFIFSVSKNIELDSYTLASSGFFLGDPDFNIREGVTVLSGPNTAIASGDTNNFVDGPVALTAGTDYIFITNFFGAAVQSYMASWQYSTTVVPVPAAVWLMGPALGVLGWQGRKRVQ
ncbi:MAG: hypothetical protein HKO62_03795 [Gammaproteobacteria bacterium]|nr:VPLPA-CTERM sorting domain-containing protein [Gammaproteobacteria bacterium]NNL99850.1 hypothetical protein [Gammaproteobacteria bacterium]